MSIPPKTHQARTETIHHARHVLGNDPARMPAAASGPAPYVDLRWIDPQIAPCLRKLASFGRFVFHDNQNGHQGASLPGPGHSSATGGLVKQEAGSVLDTIAEFVTGVRAVASPDRFLGTVLFVDVAESTKLAAEIGDSRFRDLLSGFVQLLRHQADRYQGRLIDTAGDGALVLFDSPARAIGCAESVREGARALGLPVRAGVHTGEMERGPAGEVRGIAVHTGARVSALAGAGEIYVSRTVRDLVAGAPIRLESRGTHDLKGVPGCWEIFAVL